jgi:hypothetical protein
MPTPTAAQKKALKSDDDEIVSAARVAIQAAK